MARIGLGKVTEVNVHVYPGDKFTFHANESQVNEEYDYICFRIRDAEDKDITLFIGLAEVSALIGKLKEAEAALLEFKRTLPANRKDVA